MNLEILASLPRSASAVHFHHRFELYFIARRFNISALAVPRCRNLFDSWALSPHKAVTPLLVIEQNNLRKLFAFW
jgi:hypothetical protein